MKLSIYGIGLALAVLVSEPTWAYFQQDLMRAKVLARQDYQWNLFDWLAQKRQVALMDHWLAMNRTKNWFDLSLGGGFRRWRLRTEQGAGFDLITYNSQIYHAEAQIYVLSLTGEYEETENHREAFGGAAGLRLLGTSSQDTSLVARYGWRRDRNLTTQEGWDQTYVEGDLQIYLFRYMGIDGGYRHYFNMKSNKDSEKEGYRSFAGGFLELFIFRLYGRVFEEPFQITRSDGTRLKEIRRGAEAGLKFMF